LTGPCSFTCLVACNLGLEHLVGVAPDADLVAAIRDETSNLVGLSDFCIEEGARVVLHEYAPWVGYHLDGSSDLEAFIDKTVDEGVAHINPVGNLSTSDKLCKRPIPAGAETVIPIEAPPASQDAPFHSLGLSLLWRDVTRALSFSLEDPTGVSKPLTMVNGTLYEDWHDGLMLWAAREDSSRGTARLDVYVFGAQMN